MIVQLRVTSGVRVLTTINVSLRVSDAKNVDVEQADNLTSGNHPQRRSYVSMLVGRELFELGMSWDIQQMSFQRGATFSESTKNPDVPPFRHARNTWKTWKTHLETDGVFNLFVVRRVDTNLFSLKTTKSWTCCFYF